MLAAAVQIAREAGRLALDLRGSVACSSKADGTWVTEADRAVEELVRRRLGEAFPQHPVYGEEFGGAAGVPHGWCWFVDPIDGTINYFTGLPTWGVSIGLLRDGVPHVGAVYLPVTDEMFQAEAGQGALLNGCLLRIDPQGRLHNSSLWALNSDALQSLRAEVPGVLRNLGSAAAHACYVASGALTAAVFELWRIWDIAAAFCIATEAGADIRYTDGRELGAMADLPADHEGETVVVAPPWAMDTALEGLKPAR